MKRLFLMLMAAGIFLIPILAYKVAPAQDIQGSKDHPMLNRMPGYQISEYAVREYDAFEFSIDDEDAKKTVEGKKIEINYELSDGATAASEIQVVRNYVNALKKISGQVVYERSNLATVKVAKEGMETWVSIDVYNSGDNYTLTFIEKQGMQQAIVADASSMGQSIRSTGKVSLYGLYFDSGQAQIKPESEASLKEIAKLLKENPALTLYVVGHTDNVGNFDANMKLSQARSLAVVQALVNTYGIASGRLKAHGAASLSPVASNATSEGKALNRRVELVEQ